MINLDRAEQSSPYIKFYSLYDNCLKNNQKNSQAIAICSFDSDINEVDARFVNLKYILGDEWIFFTNYNSPKSIQFRNHDQISAILYWDSIDIQIRLKAKIKRTTDEFNQEYFFDRSEEKNALAISSNQSKPIDSYGQVKENYNKSLKNDDLKKCPEYWGGYSFTPHYFEFWEGHESRINKREIFEKIDGVWKHSFLQP